MNSALEVSTRGVEFYQSDNVTADLFIKCRSLWTQNLSKICQKGKTISWKHYFLSTFQPLISLVLPYLWYTYMHFCIPIFQILCIQNIPLKLMNFISPNISWITSGTAKTQVWLKHTVSYTGIIWCITMFNKFLSLYWSISKTLPDNQTYLFGINH